MENTKKGSLFIIAAPSGAGKTSLVKEIVNQVDNVYASVSHTTRNPRAGETEGEEYYFVTDSEFTKLINQNQFLEYAKVFGNYYGTSRNWVEKTLAEGKNIILEIDWQGARQVSSLLRNTVGIFILPPDYKTLYERLVNRQNDEIETIENRMKAAKDEISHYKEFDYIVVNDDFEEALADIKAIITATNQGKCRQSDYFDEIVNRILAEAD